MRLALAALALVAAAPVCRAAGTFSPEERQTLSGYRTLLGESPDPCRLAPRLATEYKRILSTARREQDVVDIRAAVDAEPAILIRLADGIRLSGAFALYDYDTHTIYLSSASISARLPAKGCPSDERIRNLARETVGVYVHEIAHSLEREELGKDYVETSEAEILAYARESRFLAGVKGWPSRSVVAEMKRRRELERLIEENQKILGRVKDLQKDPAGDGINKLKGYVDRLEAIRQRMERLEAKAVEVDSFQISLAVMVDAWREGWGPFLGLMLRQTRSKPSLSRREENLARARPFLESAVTGLTNEAPGSLAHQLLQRSIKLGEQDVRFWGDEKKVARALKFYKRRFREVRPRASKDSKGV